MTVPAVVANTIHRAVLLALIVRSHPSKLILNSISHPYSLGA